MAGLQLINVRKHFERTAVLRGIDLTIHDGEFISLVGPSGCGKSTLLRIIAGLETQSDGDILIDGRNVNAVKPSQRDLSMVFQSYALYPHLSVADNIAVPLRMRRLGFWGRLPAVGGLLPGARRAERQIRADVEQVAALLDIEELLARKPGQLSGGQRQRVAVGRAIVREPKAFLLDEPLSNLDAKLRVHMRSEIAQLNRRLAATFIYVTHDQAEAMTMSCRIAVMMDGELVQVGTPDEVYNNPADIRVAEFIGSPKINLLVGRVEPSGIVTIGGRATGLAVAASAGEARIGIRPEALRLSAPGSAPIVGEVTHTENLGAEMMVHFKTADATTTAIMRVDADHQARFSLGDPVGVDFRPRDAHVFDDAGRRLEAEQIDDRQVVNG